jgi:hypothetical protein
VKKFIALGFASAFLVGCATTQADYYKPISESGRYGYSERLSDDGNYVLTVTVPTGGEANRLPFEIWDRRAAVLCGGTTFEKNVYKASRETVNAPGAYVYGGVGMGGGRAGAFTVEGQLTCDSEISTDP